MTWVSRRISVLAVSVFLPSCFFRLASSLYSVQQSEGLSHRSCVGIARRSATSTSARKGQASRRGDSCVYAHGWASVHECPPTHSRKVPRAATENANRERIGNSSRV